MSSERAAAEERLRRVEQRLRALREIGLALESTMSLDDVLTEVVERITRLMGAERSTLFLVGEDGRLVSRVLEGDGVSEISLEPGQGIAGWVARHGRPLIVDDAYADERFDSSWDEQTGFRTGAVLCHPIEGRRGSVIGVAEVLNKGEGSFDAEDRELLGLLCGQLSLTIENSRLMVDLVEKNRAISAAKLDLERRNRELRVLFEIERLVARAEDIDSLGEMVLGRILSITGGSVGVLHRVDENGAESRVMTRERGPLRLIRVEPGSGFSGWAAGRDRKLCLAEPKGDPRFDTSIEKRIGISLRNLAVVSLPFGEESSVRGSLLAANKESTEGFDESDMVMLDLVASQIAAAMTHLEDRVARERDRRLATVGRLLAGVLHDLKSPITVISGYAEMLADRAGGEDAEEYLEHMHRALDRISTMAEDIISFSRGERNVLLRPVDLGDFLERLIRQMIPHLASGGIELRQFVRTSGTVRVDEDKLTRVFMNIAVNAVEAMPDGGTLIVEVDRLDDEVVFGFTDTGPGIPEEIQGSLFESFVTMGKEHGTGLGLAVSREIVEAHGGRISYTTSPGGGTTFMVSIRDDSRWARGEASQT